MLMIKCIQYDKQRITALSFLASLSSVQVERFTLFVQQVAVSATARREKLQRKTRIGAEEEHWPASYWWGVSKGCITSKTYFSQALCFLQRHAAPRIPLTTRWPWYFGFVTSFDQLLTVNALFANSACALSRKCCWRPFLPRAEIAFFSSSETRIFGSLVVYKYYILPNVPHLHAFNVSISFLGLAVKPF